MHPVEGDQAWSESYYFNCYDPDTDTGFYTRCGIRPNDGTMDIGMSNIQRPMAPPTSHTRTRTIGMPILTQRLVDRRSLWRKDISLAYLASTLFA